MIHRQISEATRILYLTFDDGPHPEDTPLVLELLEQYQAKATFFMVAERAQQYPHIVQDILKRGHSIGNHSLDHRYGVFFRGQKALQDWVSSAEQIFKKIGAQDLVGFRPPVGIVTPELKRALHSLNIPLILWNTRFFDSTWRWTPVRALKSLRRMQSGSIILLHDVQKPQNRDAFLETLQIFVQKAQEQNWRFNKLERSLF